MSKSIVLKVSSAFLVGGQVARAGELVEVTVTEAKDLLSRGKAVLATADDAPKLQEPQQQEGEGTQANEGQNAAPVAPAAKAQRQPKKAK